MANQSKIPWATPQIVVLVRHRLQEEVLITCKNYGAGFGVQPYVSHCFYGCSSVCFDMASS